MCTAISDLSGRMLFAAWICVIRIKLRVSLTISGCAFYTQLCARRQNSHLNYSCVYCSHKRYAWSTRMFVHLQTQKQVAPIGCSPVSRRLAGGLPIHVRLLLARIQLVDLFRHNGTEQTFKKLAFEFKTRYDKVDRDDNRW